MNMRPAGFTPLFRSSAFLDLLGPIYNQRSDTGLVIGLRAEEKHCNARGLVHGGVFSSLAIDYAGTAKLGDWITLETDVQKVGKSLAFANCCVVVESVRIARASAVLSVITG